MGIEILPERPKQQLLYSRHLAMRQIPIDLYWGMLWACSVANAVVNMKERGATPI